MHNSIQKLDAEISNTNVIRCLRAIDILNGDYETCFVLTCILHEEK